jgi:hypothetical protein
MISYKTEWYTYFCYPVFPSLQARDRNVIVEFLLKRRSLAATLFNVWISVFHENILVAHLVKGILAFMKHEI